eukprot:12134941-Prorocentrum_lima.AAC.1
MTSSLVGSEMCIRDRLKGRACSVLGLIPRTAVRISSTWDQDAETFCPVSYTHLTLPTICSV